jgi:uncharacterized repeat protein (TIGR03803 family)
MRHRRLPAVLTITALSCLVLSMRAGASNPTLDILYSFTNGLSPEAGVVLGTNGSFYGVTATGGPGNNGGVFEVTSNGVLTNLVWLNGTDGAAPLAPLTPDKSGNFYGTASSGGVGSNGTVFKFTAAGQIRLLASFNNTNGSTPLGPLLKGTNGWYYGTTFNGGASNLGTIFCVSTAGVLSNLYSFGGSDGANPAAGLVQGANGGLYGTTEYGGDYGLGTVYEWTSSNTLATVYSFTNTAGAFPGGLLADASGNFYGATLSGGGNVPGTIFKLTPGLSLKTLAMFDFTDGASPNSPLTEGGQGNFYGTTENGGAYGHGTIFLLNTRGFLADLVSFEGTNGSAPRWGLIAGTNGNYYGTTSAGGASGNGVIYELTGFAPYIIKPPVRQSFVSNHVATFSVQAGGTAPLSYQWLFDGANNLPNATNSTLVVTNEQLTNSGTYTIVVSNAFGTALTNVVLSVVAPTVAIASPPATVSNAALAVAGTASGPHGVAAVLCQLNSNSWAAAAGAAAWQTNVTLRPGTNKFQAQSVDPVGNPSAVKSATIFYATQSPLTLKTNGPGSIRAGFTGTNLLVGRAYAMRGVPAANWLFASWTGAFTATNTATNNPLTFLMQSNMTITANFVTNPFIAAAGNYEGLFFTSNAVAEQSAGLLSSLVLENTGACSGSLVVKGLHYGFTGSFDPSQQANLAVARSEAQGGRIVMNLTLSSNEVTGTVSGTDAGGWKSSLLAERAGKSVGSAQYTMLIPPGPGAPSNAPPGDGYALVTNHNGAVIIAGALADGAAFNQAASIVGDGDVPFYASLYNNTGLVLGWLNLSNTLTASNLCWIKTPSSASPLYANGFTNIVTNALTSIWTNLPASYVASATLAISNTSLGLDFVVLLTHAGLSKEAGLPTNSLTSLLYPKTGLLKIVFGNGAGKDTTTGYAVILEDSNGGGGYFVTKTNAGTITLAP